ncbi:MAG: EF-hand domain-containing protein [Methanosarcinales archaeon]|nr:MAG: EF-hand domain-containing protein [Methanosarcinales archaeon]
MEALKRHPVWEQLYGRDRRMEVYMMLSERDEKRLTVRELFASLFTMVDSAGLESMLKWSDPKIVSGADRPAVDWREMLTPEDIEELTAVFEAMDADGSGTVSVAEIKAVMGSNHKGANADQYQWTALDIEDIMRDFDEDENAELDVEEFLTLMAESMFGTRHLRI